MVKWFVAGQRWSAGPNQLHQDSLAAQLGPQQLVIQLTLDHLETLRVDEYTIIGKDIDVYPVVLNSHVF